MSLFDYVTLSKTEAFDKQHWLSSIKSCNLYNLYNILNTRTSVKSSNTTY